MLERLANIRHKTAISSLIISTGIFAVILFAVRQQDVTRNITYPAELIPKDWEVIRMPWYSFGYPTSRNLERTSDGYRFTNDSDEPLVFLQDITTERAITLHELAQAPTLSTADFAFADQPARRYVFFDHDVYIIAVGRRAYRLETYGHDPTLQLFLATVRFSE